MEVLLSILLEERSEALQAIRAFGLIIGVPVLLWTVDAVAFSSDGRAAIWADLERRFSDKTFALSFYVEHFNPRRSEFRFLIATLLLSLGSILIFLLGFAGVVFEFARSLVDSPAARAQYLRQLMTEGLISVFIVNFVALQVAWAMAMRLRRAGWSIWPALGIDLFMRIVLFIAAIAAIYVAASQTGGAFGGDVAKALGAVGPTLRGAIGFENVAAAYLYAAALPALPLFVAAVIDLMARYPRVGKVIRGALFYLPFRKKPILTIGLVIGVFFAIVSNLATALLGAL